MNLSESEQDIVTDRLAEFFKGATDYRFVAWDLETNGLQGSSVLSVSAMRCELQPDKSVKLLPNGTYSRFYYPEDGEQYDSGAIKVNGLSAAVVDTKRSFDYPLRFSEDIESFREFCGDIERCVTYNGIDFDSTFVPKGFFKYHFDPKPWLENFTKVPPTQRMMDTGFGNKFKTPSLKESAKWAGLNFEEESAHGSAYDTLITVKLFEVLVKASLFRPVVKN